MPLDDPGDPRPDPGGPEIDLKFTNEALLWSFRWRPDSMSDELAAACFVVAAAKLTTLTAPWDRPLNERELQEAERCFALALRKCNTGSSKLVG